MQNTTESITHIYTQQLFSLVQQAYLQHQANFSDDIELCQLISIKTGGCPEDCGYCSQSIRYETGIKLNPLLSLNEVERQVISAKKAGVRRICLGAAYKTPTTAALAKTCEYINIIKSHGLEACTTLGSLTLNQAQHLQAAGLDYYNHNIDTSPEYYSQVVTTRTFDDRLVTLANVAAAGLKVCCGGIIGMGESRADRISFIQALTNLPTKPESIPVNLQVKVPGTPLANTPKLDKLELIRTIATLRIFFPATRIRLSAGRSELSELEQAFCFMAGANSLFYGEKLLTTPNNKQSADLSLLAKLGVLTNATLA